jgi:hypothetical protein
VQLETISPELALVDDELRAAALAALRDEATTPSVNGRRPAATRSFDGVSSADSATAESMPLADWAAALVVVVTVGSAVGYWLGTSE